MKNGGKLLELKWMHLIRTRLKNSINCQKKDVYGSFERYNARLLAKGYTQTYEIDF